jgi:hypothetical protein
MTDQRKYYIGLVLRWVWGIVICAFFTYTLPGGSLWFSVVQGVFWIGAIYHGVKAYKAKEPKPPFIIVVDR